jgi:predicted phage gp36 major capsid-like protein
MWLTYLALAVGLMGIFLAWRTSRKNSELQERIAQVNSRVYHLRREMQENQEKFEHDLITLKFQMLRAQGDLKVTPEMKMSEILAIHPQAEQVLAGLHLGGCSSCSFDLRQSLGEVTAVNGREVEPILLALNNLVAASSNGNGLVSPERLKTPNIRFY